MVIAIIGIIVSFTLAVIKSSKDKADDIRVKSSIRQLRVLVEDYYDGNELSYEGFDTCVDNPTEANCLDKPIADNITVLKDEIDNANGQTDSVTVKSTIPGDPEGYCLAAPLKSAPTVFVCVQADGGTNIQESSTDPCTNPPPGEAPTCQFT